MLLWTGTSEIMLPGIFNHLKLFSFIICLLTRTLSFHLNSTGGTFPATLYQEATFSYQFVQSQDVMNYFATGSGGGKCNIMGYWHTSNTNPNAWAPPSSVLKSDQNICTDKCSSSTNCIGWNPGLKQRWDAPSRTPLDDIAASDALLSAADYLAFPDLQMFPAVAGAAVPIYNIPELRNISQPIILGRNLIANIFMGNVRYWNDPSVLAIQVPSVRAVLANLNQLIQVVVRTDSSGTTDIFTTALNFFQPAGLRSPDYSFSAVVGSGQTPSWCGPKTDEIQIITTSACNSSWAGSDRLVTLALLTPKFTIASISFACNALTGEVKASFEAVLGLNSMKVTRTQPSPMSYAYTVGYFLPGAANKFEPYVSSTGGASVTIRTLQEGGYLNAHYNSSYSLLPELQSLFVNASASPVFTISDPNNPTHPLAASSPIYVTSTNSSLSAAILGAVNALSPGLLLTVTRVKHSGGWDEYKLVFQGAKDIKSLVITSLSAASSVLLTTYQHGSNYPLFYDNQHPQGFSGSGRYTCYRHDQNLTSWSYYAGYGTVGVIAEVTSIPYSIGYAVLNDAVTYNVPIASLINFAGNVIQANSTSVTYAVMEKGGSLNQYFTALISDGHSAKVWPIAGYTYWIIRTTKHLGTCERRRRAMQFLLNFYESQTVVQIAASLGFSTLPSFIRDIVVNKLKSVAMCSNGEFAFNATAKLPLSVPDVMVTPVASYVSAYYNIDSSFAWNVTHQDDSLALWNQYISSANTFIGVATILMSKAQKLAQYSLGGPGITTTAFAHFAVIPIYNLVSFTGASVPLRVTPDILAKIYTGVITYWNDSAIQTVNFSNRKRLPYQPIIVVYRSGSSDINKIFSRFLALRSPPFQSLYSVGPDGIRTLDPTPNIAASRLRRASDNAHVDSYVTFTDGAIGYYAQVGTPNSATASFCQDSSCSTVIAPSNPSSLASCEADPSTVVPLAKGTTYDLMLSTAPSCYPLAATVDYSFLSLNSAGSCLGGTSGLADRRVAFNAWLYNGTALTAPLTALAMQGTSSLQRAVTYNGICDITCNGQMLGYQYCGYRDCSWDSQTGGGDYRQVVSACNSETGQRTVSYVLTPGNACIQRANDPMRSTRSIDCDYLPRDAPIGVACYVLLTFGTLTTLYVIARAATTHSEKVKRSDPAFVYVFLLGAVLMHVVILPFIGPLQSSDCIAMHWLYSTSITLMYGPLVLKLTILDLLVNSKHHHKFVVSYFTVILQVLGLLLVDVIILSAWMAVHPPLAKTVMNTYNGVLAPVADVVCDAEVTNPFMIAVMVWKVSLMGFGLLKAVSTWNVQSSVSANNSDSKQFAVALGIGILSYMLSIFLNLNAESNVLLQCVCNFLCSILSVFLIMLPKLVDETKEMDLDKEVAKKMKSASKMTLLTRAVIVRDSLVTLICASDGSAGKPRLRSKLENVPKGIPMRSGKFSG